MGHALAGHDPDKTYLDIDKAMDMAHGTYNLMQAYLKQRGYDVKDNWDKIAPQVREKLEEFSRQYNPNDDR